MRVYIVGPMLGIPDNNYPAFAEAAQRWRGAGHEVMTPPELNDECFAGNTRMPSSTYLKKDIEQMIARDIEALALLPGCGASRGATFEIAAAMMFGLRFFDAITMKEQEAPESALVIPYKR